MRSTSFPSGTAERVCGFWDYDGMADGLSFDALWYLNQEFVEDASFIDAEWFGGASGNWWVCFISPEGPLEDGVYELLLNVEGENASGEAIIIGGDHPTRTLEIVNDTAEDICFVLISLSDAQDWGSDELGETEVISPGSSRVFEVPGAFYDVQAFDCDARPGARGVLPRPERLAGLHRGGVSRPAITWRVSL